MNVSTCPNECSKNGLCINGKCHCLTGYSGIDCSSNLRKIVFFLKKKKICFLFCAAKVVSCVENKAFGCVKCSNSHCLQCANGLLLSLDQSECVEDCERGQFRDETNICRSCPENCTKCTSLIAC